MVVGGDGEAADGVVAAMVAASAATMAVDLAVSAAAIRAAAGLPAIGKQANRESLNGQDAHTTA